MNVKTNSIHNRAASIVARCTFGSLTLACLQILFVGQVSLGQTDEVDRNLPVIQSAEDLDGEKKSLPWNAARSESVPSELITTDVQPTTNRLQTDLRNIDLSTAPKLATPKLEAVPNQFRNSAATSQTWKSVQWTAPNDVYQNLLFEEPLLERHGIGNGVTRLNLLKDERLQPVVSGLKFFTAGAFYPLDVLRRRHKRCDNPLGWGLPDSY
ncbi:MAG: hypothetical protein AB8B55_20640 [Mariniblastus sp.]